MRLLLIALLAMSISAEAATTYTEFYCQTAGDNLNAGSTTDNSAVHTYAAGTFVRATGIFTVASGDPASDGVAAGQWASVYTTAGATVATFVARVTGADATTITVSLSAIAGAVTSVSEGAGAATCKVGGAWKGPNAAVGFPFDFALSTLTDASGNVPRINLKNNATYSTTALITHSKAGPLLVEGYSGSPGDGGVAVIDNGTTAANVMTLSGANVDVGYITFQSSATTGTGRGLSVSGGENIIFNCIVHDVRDIGFNGGEAGVTFSECEAYACNKGNGSGAGAFTASVAGVTFIRCIAHDNTAAANGYGFSSAACDNYLQCISYGNSKVGFLSTSTAGAGTFISCDAYNNGTDGLSMTAASATDVYIQNCNFVKNTGFGINSSGSSVRNGLILNCGFGAGTMANGSGDIATTIGGIKVIGSISYTANQTPWNSPATGDFRITLAAAEGSGRGLFNATATVSYPDIGAGQRTSVQSASTTSVHSFPIFQ